MHTFYYSDRIIVIIIGNNSKNIHRLRSVKCLLSASASASAFPPSTPILFHPKVVIKWKNNRLIIVIINKNRNFVQTFKIIIHINTTKYNKWIIIYKYVFYVLVLKIKWTYDYYDKIIVM